MLQKRIDGKEEPFPKPREPKGHKRPRVEVAITDEERGRIEAAMVKEVLDRGEPWELGRENLGPWILRAALQAAEIIEGSCAPDSRSNPTRAGERARARAVKDQPSIGRGKPDLMGPGAQGRAAAAARPEPHHAIEGKAQVLRLVVPLRVACPSCGAKRGWPCLSGDESARPGAPHQARIEKADDQAADKRTRESRRKPAPALAPKRTAPAFGRKRMHEGSN